MSPYRKNILVGATVLGGIVVFGWLFLQFSGRILGTFTPPQIAIQFESTRGDGLSNGSAVNYLGVPAGRVTAVRYKPDGTGVLIDTMINRDPALPANIHAVISSSNALGGTAGVNLDLDGQIAQGQLRPTTQPIRADYVGLQLNVLSKPVTEAVSKVGDMSAAIRETADQLNRSHVINDLDTTIKQVQQTADAATVTLAAMNKTVGDPKTVEDFRAAIASIRTTSDNAASVSAKMEKLTDKLSKNSEDFSSTAQDVRVHMDELSKQLADRFAQISKVLSNVQEITDKVNKGDGTASKLVNDPQLYKELVESSKELNKTISELHQLIEQWKNDGISFH